MVLGNVNVLHHSPFLDEEAVNALRMSCDVYAASEKATKKAFKEGTSELMLELIEVLESIEDFSTSTIQNTVKEWITAKEIGFGKIMMPLRLSLVGSLQGPDVFAIIGLIGKEETISSITRAIEKM